MRTKGMKANKDTENPTATGKERPMGMFPEGLPVSGEEYISALEQKFDQALYTFRRLTLLYLIVFLIQVVSVSCLVYRNSRLEEEIRVQERVIQYLGDWGERSGTSLGE